MNVKRIITFAFVFAIIALTVGLSGCEKIAPMVPDDTTTMPEMMDGEVPIGMAVALTGPFAEPYGLPMQRGFELAREEINMLTDANITFVPVDTHSTVEGAVAAVQGLVDQGVPAIVGVGISTQLEQAFPIAQENGVVAFSSISAAAGLSSIGDYVFRTGIATNILNPGGVMATHEKLGYTKVATIYDAADTYATSSNEEITKALAAGGVEVLTEETFQTGDTDFSAQLTSIMDMAPEAVFISALSSEMVQIVVQGREIGIPATVHFIVPDLTNDEIQQMGDAAEGAIAFSGWSSMSDAPGNQTFVQNYQAKYGIEPEPWAAQSYATLYILANAIAHAQSADSAAIRDALAQTMDFPTILGNFSFDPNGEAMYDPIVLMVKDGELQTFEVAVSEMPEVVDTGIPIGLVVSLTGKDAEPYGLPMKRGFELAQEEINALGIGPGLTFVPADDQSSEAGAIAAVQQLVDQGVPAIVGIAISDYLEDAFPIAQDSGVVAFSSVSTAAGLSSIGDYVFRTGLAVDIANPNGVMITHEKLGYEKVALIYDAADTYSVSSNDELKKALEASGVEILTEETFQTGDTDFDAQLTNIMSMEPDALFISALSVEITQVVIQAGDLGIQLIVPDLTAKEIQDAGDAAEGAIAFSGWSSLSNIPGNQEFIQRYRAKYGIEPEPWAAQSYATLRILAAAIAKAGSADAAAIRDALAQTMNFPTILGNFSFDPNGEAVYDPIVLMVKDGELQLFE